MTYAGHCIDSRYRKMWEFLDKVVKESRKNEQTINRNKNIWSLAKATTEDISYELVILKSSTEI